VPAAVLTVALYEIAHSRAVPFFLPVSQHEGNILVARKSNRAYELRHYDL
jgi:hypothetical protein